VGLTNCKWLSSSGSSVLGTLESLKSKWCPAQALRLLFPVPVEVLLPVLPVDPWLLLSDLALTLRSSLEAIVDVTQPAPKLTCNILKVLISISQIRILLLSPLIKQKCPFKTVSKVDGLRDSHKLLMTPRHTDNLNDIFAEKLC
jgi:hypothetical protein